MAENVFQTGSNSGPRVHFFETLLFLCFFGGVVADFLLWVLFGNSPSTDPPPPPDLRQPQFACCHFPPTPAGMRCRVRLGRTVSPAVLLAHAAGSQQGPPRRVQPPFSQPAPFSGRPTGSCLRDPQPIQIPSPLNCREGLPKLRLDRGRGALMSHSKRRAPQQAIAAAVGPGPWPGGGGGGSGGNRGVPPTSRRTTSCSPSSC